MFTSLKVLAIALTLLAADAPFSDVEQLRRENHALKVQLHQALAQRDECRVQFAPIRFKLDQQALSAECEKLKADFEAAHPGSGFVCNPQTGALEVKSPAAVEK